jgi:diguanylate cyclase (GGDEF)-like protein
MAVRCCCSCSTSITSKAVNDRYGHSVGDEVLQAFSKSIGASLPRASDWFARMGAEEFVIVLPHTDLAGAGVVAEKLRANVASTPIRTSAGLVAITASIGVASLEALAAERAPATTNGTLKLADRHLYASKKGGRNRVSVPRSLQVDPCALRACPSVLRGCSVCVRLASCRLIQFCRRYALT